MAGGTPSACEVGRVPPAAPTSEPARRAVDALRAAGVGRGDLVAVSRASTGIGLAGVGGSWAAVADDDRVAAVAAAVEAELRPRWVWWSPAVVHDLGIEPSTCWDVGAVHQLIEGGARRSPGHVWARLQGLDPAGVPLSLGGAETLFAAADRELGDPDDPVRPDGHLRADWGGIGWAPTEVQLARWAEVAVTVAAAQVLERAAGEPAWSVVARSESTAAVLAEELGRDGLPFDREVAESILQEVVGPRPRSPQEADALRAARDDAVLAHVPRSADVDLRSPGSVRSLLRRVGIEVEDTRAWRLRTLVDAHPVVPALLAWRKAERLATTTGYDWLDTNVHGGRLRGRWEASDGGAGRMTATAGLHSLPATLRPAVAADPGWVLVRADLGQVEPRVLAVVSGDDAFARATQADDLYAEVGQRLGVEREIAKLAVLGAMYGQTTGQGAQALAELRRTFPTAVDHLEVADDAARRGEDLRTHGGRRLRIERPSDGDVEESVARSREAARGRYGRNALVQGAAAELFKLWAVVVRARVRPLGGRVVLCLHDELLVHAPAEVADEAAATVDAALQEAVARWAPGTAVRFLADTSVVARWSDVAH